MSTQKIDGHGQAIQTKFLPATNTKGSRIKAWCERGSIIVSCDDSAQDPHEHAVRALVAKFVAEDAERYGTKRNPWTDRLVRGGLPGGGWAYVYVR